jgi:Bacterial archaeo-eukaryotic release factor family 11
MAQHIDIPTRPEIAALLDERDPASVSIYLPTSPLPQDADADRIEFKNLAAEAVGQLEAAGADRATVAGVREHVDDLLDDEEFWTRLATSLAAFVTPDGVRTFRLPNRLTSMVEVSDRMHLKPLLRSVTFPQAAVVLALAQGSVRLIEVAADVPAEKIPVAELPRDAASAVGKASITDRTASGRIQGSEGQKVHLRQYSRLVDRAVRPVLAGLGLPLILAAVEPLASIYRSVNSYPGLADEGIPGNPEARSDQELADAARGVLDRLYAAELAQVREVFEARVSQGRGATDLTDVARAATFGAVDTLLADIDQVVPGFVDEESGTVTLDESDDAANYGVVDELARRVLLSGGRVLALRADDIPGDTATAAILRYPV